LLLIDPSNINKNITIFPQDRKLFLAFFCIGVENIQTSKNLQHGKKINTKLNSNLRNRKKILKYYSHFRILSIT
jgi:hypothetical protein